MSMVSDKLIWRHINQRIEGLAPKQ